MALRQSYAHSAALRALQLDVDHGRDRSAGFVTDLLRFHFGKQSQLVLAALAEGLLGARGAHRPAGLADDVGPRSAGKGALAGGIESGRMRHFAAYVITDRRAPPPGFLVASSRIAG